MANEQHRLDILAAAWLSDSAQAPVTYREGVNRNIPAMDPYPTPEFDRVREELRREG